MRPLSIRVRLTLWYTGLLLGILLLISGLSYSMLRRSISQDLDASLMTSRIDSSTLVYQRVRRVRMDRGRMELTRPAP